MIFNMVRLTIFCMTVGKDFIKIFFFLIFYLLLLLESTIGSFNTIAKFAHLNNTNFIFSAGEANRVTLWDISNIKIKSDNRLIKYYESKISDK